ncbi:hypothetical protein ElyMa_005448700 [Elysia marginata]|uniref:Uncharacterized protein n=1 Tax=Elysia marginata TaxID=1093978 RepID=A0AAV4ENZ9_9GAST|nr:hypothetical protein ElyMa_005448700 [Elysia marginata]
MLEFVICACNTQHICKSLQTTVAPTKAGPAPKPVVNDESDDDSDVVVIILAVFVGFLFIVVVIIILLAVLTCTGRISWKKAGETNRFYQESMGSGPRRPYNGSQSSSSFAASAGEMRPPLPRRNRNDTVSSERATPAGRAGYTNKAFSDILSMQPGHVSADVDNETGRSRSLSVEDTRKVGSDRYTPSPHALQGTELSASQVSTLSSCDTSGLSDNSSRPGNNSNREAFQMGDTLKNGLEKLLYQPQQQTQCQHFGQIQQQQPPDNKFKRPTYPGSSSSQPRLPPEEMRHQQQLMILQALQHPNLDERLRQQYLALLYETLRPDMPHRQQQGPINYQQPHLENSHRQNPHYNKMQQQQQPLQRPRQPQVVLGEQNQAVFFSNVTDASAIYSIHPSPNPVVSPSGNPDYIYVLTAEGIVQPVPYENYASLRKSGPTENPHPGASERQGSDNRFPNENNTRESQRFYEDKTVNDGAKMRAEQAPHDISDERDYPNQVQPVVHNSGNRDSLVYAHISNLNNREGSSHPYMAVCKDEINKDDVARESEQESGISKLTPPAPHVCRMTPDYLRAIPDSGPEQAAKDQDLGPGIPGLVVLPKEAFLMQEDQPADSSQQNYPSDGVFQVPNDTKTQPRLSYDKNDMDLKPAHGCAITNTVASSDYPVKMNQIRMSPALQQTPVPSVVQNTRQAAHSNSRPSHAIHTNRSPPYAYGYSNPRIKIASHVENDPPRDEASNQGVEPDRDQQTGKSTSAGSDPSPHRTPAVEGDRVTDVNRMNPISSFLDPETLDQNSNKNNSVSNNTNPISFIGSGQKYVHGAGLSIPQNPDILENLSETDNSNTDV